MSLASPLPFESTIESLLEALDLKTVSRKAKRETRRKDFYYPPLSVYRWWARRSVTSFLAVLSAMEERYELPLRIADPFAGGGTSALAAVLKGHQIYAQDVNPWAVAGLSCMLTLPETAALQRAIDELWSQVEPFLKTAYGTRLSDGTPAMVRHTLRVATAPCSSCGHGQRLFPHALVTLLQRKERQPDSGILACPQGHLFQGLLKGTSRCPLCQAATDPEASYTVGRTVQCGTCKARETLASRVAAGGWDWEVVLVERVSRDAREIDFASPEEITAAESGSWQPGRLLGEIPRARETKVLLRHGFSRWTDLYPRRQQAALEHLLDACAEIDAPGEVTAALQLTLVGFAEMAGYLARWDRYYLRSYEAMAAHRFSFTTLPAELNPWASWEQGGRGSVPSRLRSLLKAAGWLSNRLTRPLRIQIRKEAEPQVPGPSQPDAVLVCGDSARMLLPDCEIDLVLTDPPYFDDIHYDDLSRLLRLWAGLPSETLLDDAVPARPLPIEERRSHYRRVLACVFGEANRVLSLEGHLVLTFSNRDPRAWVDLFEALQQAGFQAAGCAAVHSENETDLSKRNRRACRYDLLLDLVPDTGGNAEVFVPFSWPRTREGDFLRLVAGAFRQLGNLKDGWDEQFLRQCRDCRFLQAPTKKRSLKKRDCQPS